MHHSVRALKLHEYPIVASLAFASALIAFVGSPAPASADSPSPTIFAHVVPAAGAGSCNLQSLGTCENAVTHAAVSSTGGYYVYVLASRGNLTGVNGVGFGINYNPAPNAGVDVFSWTTCGTISFETAAWPNPGSGTIVSFNPSTCAGRQTVVAGYLYIGAYTPDVLRIIARPTNGVPEVVDCSNHFNTVASSNLGYVSFSTAGDVAGFNPCSGSAAPDNGPPPDTTPTDYLVVHLAAPTTVNACSSGHIAACSSAVTHGAVASPGVGPYYFAYVLANTDTRFTPDVGGVQFGVTYDGNRPGGSTDGHGIDVFSWTPCGNLQFPSAGWPEPGSGNLVTWDTANNCARGPIVVTGYFYLGAYAADRLQLIPRPVDGFAKVANCLGAEAVVPEARLGFATFSAGGLVPGCNPCDGPCRSPVPVQMTTWGGIKSAFAKF